MGDPILDGRTGQSFQIAANTLYCLDIEGLAVLYKLNGNSTGFKNGLNFEILKEKKGEKIKIIKCK